MALIDLDLIEDGQRLRGLDGERVKLLADSMRDVGLIHPIAVYPRKLFRGGNQVDGYGLVAGLHRKAAWTMLGHTEIEANVVDLSDLECQIAECDENLCAPKLTPAERALFTRRRKEAYEALHPETKHGVNQHTRGDANLATPNFAEDQAAKTGASERSVARDAERGEKILPEVLAMLQGTDLNTGAYLDQIKKLTGSEQHRAVKRDLRFSKQQRREEAKRAKEAEQAQAERVRRERLAELSPEIQAMEEAKEARRTQKRSGAEALTDQQRLEELAEANRVLAEDNERLKTENAKFGDMAVLYEQGGFEAVIAAKDAKIAALETRLAQENADKVSWMTSAKSWKKRAIESGWSDPRYIEVPEGAE